MANNEATEFRQFLSNNPFVIQKGLDSFIVTNFAPNTKKYNVVKRKYGYKIQKLKSGAQPVEFYIPVISQNDVFFQDAKPTIFNFVGRPGAGKGTHGGHFAEIYGLPFVKMGELIRNTDDQTAKKTDLANEIVDTELKNNSGLSICLDGYPRNFAQKNHLLSYLTDYNIFTVFLSANKQECINRMMLRHDGHEFDQDAEVSERRMEHYGKYTRQTIANLADESKKQVGMYYTEISIVTGADKQVNFNNMISGMNYGLRRKNSQLMYQKLHIR